MSSYFDDRMAERAARREQILAVRGEFFQALQVAWSAPPNAVDDVMGQSSYFIQPETGDDAVAICDTESGVLAQSFSPPKLWGRDLKFIYSIWMAGDWLRFGVLIQGDPRLVSRFSSSNECTEGLERVWDRPATYMSRDGGLLMEWRFEDAKFYDDFLIEDRYAKIVRHLHFQIGHSIHEAFIGVAFGENESN